MTRVLTGSVTIALLLTLFASVLAATASVVLAVEGMT